MEMVIPERDEHCQEKQTNQDNVKIASRMVNLHWVVREGLTGEVALVFALRSQ